jgi:ABC-type oligopeptide transport system substrate-binding subunit
MHGDPKYADEFTHFDYVNPNAPKGGTLRLSQLGTFDSLNPFIIHGVAAAGRHLVHESLMQRSADEPFSLYGLLAQRIEIPDDRAWVEFYLNPKARFRDGRPVTIDDVIFSLEVLRDHGRPNHHAYYSQVTRIDRLAGNGVRFSFGDAANRELPLILGLMPILPRHFFTDTNLADLRLQPIPGSGPYRVAEVDPGRQITYQRDPTYWGGNLAVNQGRYNFDEIVYDYYRDKNAALEAFLAGQVDLRAEQDPRQWMAGYSSEAVRNGDMIKQAVPHGRPSGMRGFVFNTRQVIFQDQRVRQALTLAFDFEWVNRSLFHNAYDRTESYFGRSDLEAPLQPGSDELLLMQELGIDTDIKNCGACRPLKSIPRSSGPSNRGNLIAATKLLNEAGWQVSDGILVNQSGVPFAFEILIVDPGNARLAQQLARDLARLGIQVEVRIVDSAQFQERTATYDYDMIVYYWGQSLSPGNEQAFYWGTASKDQPGTRNYMGVKDPALDATIDRLVNAITRADLITATRLLDRTLRAGHYVIPLYHLPVDWLAYWARLQRPPNSPLLGYSLESWWSDGPRK